MAVDGGRCPTVEGCRASENASTRANRCEFPRSRSRVPSRARLHPSSDCRLRRKKEPTPSQRGTTARAQPLRAGGQRPRAAGQRPRAAGQPASGSRQRLPNARAGPMASDSDGVVPTYWWRSPAAATAAASQWGNLLRSMPARKTAVRRSYQRHAQRAVASRHLLRV